MTLDEMTNHVEKHAPGSWFTWSDWFGHAAMAIAILYRMRGGAKTPDEFMDSLFSGEMRDYVKHMVQS